MADPLSVAGLAAGLVSLGLQVCGNVIAYLDALDCREQDLAALRHQHNSVHQTLQVVEASLVQLQRTHQRATAAVRSCLDACHAELEDLSAVVAEFSGGNKSETSRREKLKSHGKKLLYPFSRPKLEHLETRLRNANAALQLALQALGLSVSQSSSEQLADIESISHSMSASLSAISTPLNRLNTRFDSLENLVTQLVVHSPVLTSPVTISPSPKRPGAPRYPGRPNQHRTPPTPPPSEPGSPTTPHRDQFQALVSSFTPPPSEPGSPTTPHRDQFQALVSSFSGGIGICICRPSRILKRDTFGWGPVGLSFETTGQKHLPGCPISQIAEQDQTRIIGMKYTGLRRLIGSALELSFAMKSGAGGWAISPSFTYYHTVDPNTAPEFRILGSLVESLESLMSDRSAATEERFSSAQWEKLVALALAKILRLFQARKASPLSVDTANRSLTHVAARCIRLALYIFRSDLAEPLIQLLRYLIMHNVPANKYDLEGWSPLSTLLASTYGDTTQHIEAAELIVRSNPESAPPCVSYTPYPMWSCYSDGEKYKVIYPVNAAMGFLGSSPHLAEAYGCGPLSLAILANDAAQVNFLLQHHPSTLDERNLFGQSPLHLAVKNPSCLRLLVRIADDKLLDLEDYGGAPALETAVQLSGSQCNKSRGQRRCRRCHCAESAIILIKAGCSIPVPGTLSRVLEPASFRCKQRYIRGIQNRREQLKRLARDNLSIKEAESLGLFKASVLDSQMPRVVQLLDQRGVQVPEFLRHPTTRGYPVYCIYHVLLDSEDADLFFRLGFHELNFSQDHTERETFRWFPMNYLRWLDEHGVDILRQGVELSESQAAIVGHITFGGIGRSTVTYGPRALLDYIPWFKKLAGTALSTAILDIADRCRCECWLGGCTPLTTFLNNAIYTARYEYDCQGAILTESEKVGRTWAWSIRNIWDKLGPKYHADALRLMTFKALQIRHTCGHQGHQPSRHNKAEDVPFEPVEEHTPDELALLEELLDEFGRELAPVLADEDEVRRIDGLVGFWEQTWPRRMDEVLEQLAGDKLSEEERRRAEEIGVVWDRPAGPEVKKEGNPYEVTMPEHWFYELDQIVVE